MKDVAILSSVRTAIGKANRGSLKDVRPDDLAGFAIKEAVARAGVSAESVEDLILGCAMPEAEQGMNVARIAGYRGGLTDSASAATINRFCSSGLHAISDVAKSIMVGQIDVGVAGGVESMSLVPMGGHRPSANPTLMEANPAVYTPMGLTAENVAKKYGITREAQDAFALQSHERALAAIAAGNFKSEIVPIEVDVYSASGKKRITFDTDEGPRAGSTLETLAKLRPAFDAKGTVTAANSSQVSDGAAAAVLMDAEKARAAGHKPVAYFRAFVTAGVDPSIMGIGPIPAVRKLLEKTGMSLDSIGVIELNEAFAAQALPVMAELGLDPAKVNPNGGAIALGHPLGATGARLVATLIPEMQRRGEKFGIATMCIGGGMGAAGLIELA